MARLTEGLRQLAAGETEAAAAGPADELTKAQDAVAQAKVRPHFVVVAKVLGAPCGAASWALLVEGWRSLQSFVFVLSALNPWARSPSRGVPPSRRWQYGTCKVAMCVRRDQLGAAAVCVWACALIR